MPFAMIAQGLPGAIPSVRTPYPPSCSKINTPCDAERPRQGGPMGISRILVVEDDPDIGAMLRTYFETQGFAISVATRGQEALTLTRHSLPQLIVLDIMLPDMDGYEVCRQR